MTALSIALTIVDVVLYPLIFLLSWLLVFLSPVLHLLRYMLHVLLLPVRVLARFETLYIYLGTAVVVGIVAGTILYYINATLVSAFELGSDPGPDRPGRAGPIRPGSPGTRQSKQGRRVANESRPMTEGARPTIDGSLKKQYADWLDAERGRRKGGLLSQIILEEDDDSEVFS